MNLRHLPRLLLALAAGLLASCAIQQPAKLDDKTSASLKAMSDKLAAAQTLRFSATRTASKGFDFGMEIPETAQISGAIKRPNKLTAVSNTNLGKRAVAYDGSTLTIVDHAGGTHATVPAQPTIDTTTESIEHLYAAKPPLADLLVNDPYHVLLDGVQSGAFAGQETVAGVTCDRFHFTQEGLTWDLWIAPSDHLPRRMLVTYPNGEGGAPLTMTLQIQQWRLGAPVSDSEFAAAVPKSSRLVEMLPLNR